ncbi:MAG: hypothetical protein MH472_04665 [Bacteroidia bacterium]|nr:hypothetical protein [Bacteroidia bacterium]
MRKLLLILLTACIFSACSNVRFDKIPGMYQDLIPMDLHGKYVFYGKDFRSKMSDTLIVNINNNEIQLSGSFGESKLVNHQDFNMHKLGDYYIIGTQDKVIKSLWNLYVIEPKDKGINFYSITEKHIKSSSETPFDTYFPFMDVPINYEPIPTEPIPLQDGNGGSALGTPSMVRYYLASDEQFKLYFEGELKNKEYVFLKKDKSKKSK